MRTRFAPPAGVTGMRLRDVTGLSDGQRHWLNAVHEAGHVVMALAARVPVRQVRIVPADRAWEDGVDSQAPEGVGFSEIYYWHGSVRDGVAVLAAGERAQDRWLREAGLWTPDRAWAVERDGVIDRAQIAELCQRVTGRDLVTYGTRRGRWDLGHVQQRVDAELGRRWPQVAAVAGALVSRLHLTEDEVTALVRVRPTRGARAWRARCLGDVLRHGRGSADGGPQAQR